MTSGDILEELVSCARDIEASQIDGLDMRSLNRIDQTALADISIPELICIREHASRNCELLISAKRGITAARKAIEHVNSGVPTTAYDADGKKLVIRSDNSVIEQKV